MEAGFCVWFLFCFEFLCSYKKEKILWVFIVKTKCKVTDPQNSYTIFIVPVEGKFKACFVYSENNPELKHAFISCCFCWQSIAIATRLAHTVLVVILSRVSARANPLWGVFAVTGVKLATGDYTRLLTLEIPAALVRSADLSVIWLWYIVLPEFEQNRQQWKYQSLQYVNCLECSCFLGLFRINFVLGVPTGSPSCGGDFRICVSQQTNWAYPLLFILLLASVSAFMALSAVFHSINSPSALL